MNERQTQKLGCFMNERQKQKLGWARSLRGIAQKAGRDYATAFQEAFPVGAEVVFQKGKGSITARIVRHSSLLDLDLRVEVENVRTYKRYWVYSFWLLDGQVIE